MYFATNKLRLGLCCILLCAGVGCQRHEPVRIDFVPINNAGAPGCNADNRSIEAKLFVYDLMLRSSDGAWFPTHSSDTDAAQIHLIEIRCGADVHQHSLEIAAQHPGPFNGLRFTVGVPETLNHQDPTLAAAPLNRADMFWVWQQGYKFMSIEATPGPTFHLGSTSCPGRAAVRPPSGPCGQNNRLVILLEDFDPAGDSVGLALGNVLEHLGETDRCTGNYQAQANCRQLLLALTLDPQTGDCGNACAQILFRRTAQ